MDEAHRIARQSAEAAARQSYGKLLAILVKISGDITAAEDALASAFTHAIEVWPVRGTPDNPEAWLLTAARREQSRIWRHLKVQDAAIDEWLMRQDERQAAIAHYPDERLTLLFACTHPAIDPGISTALMLQTVLGMNAATIASAFLTSPATMSQRLVRAKTRLSAIEAAFELPAPEDWPPRLDRVLAAIYAAFGTVWEDGTPGVDPTSDLHSEALWLARLLTACLPAEPEAKGLLALMLYCDSRRRARRSVDGSFQPLNLQDPESWSLDMLEEAEALLVEASRAGKPGRFQTEAAIQSLHIQSRFEDKPPHAALLALYDLLTSRWPSIGALVSRAAAYAQAGAHGQALVQLDAINPKSTASYQPYWATRAFILAAMGRQADARQAYDRAIGLTSDPALRQFLLTSREQLAAS